MRNQKIKLENLKEVLFEDIKVIEELKHTYSKNIDTHSLNKASDLLKDAMDLIAKNDPKVLKRELLSRVAFIQSLKNWMKNLDVKKDIEKLNEVISNCTDVYEWCLDLSHISKDMKQASGILEKGIVSLKDFSKDLKETMQKQGFFFSREEITPATASKMLSKDIQQLDDLYTKYLEIDDYINIDVLDLAQDKIKNAIVLLNQNSQKQASTDKSAILDTLMNWKASFDIGRDMKAIKEIIKDCIDTRNIYYNSADPKKVKASKELQKAITLLMDFSEDLAQIKKSI